MYRSFLVFLLICLFINGYSQPFETNTPTGSQKATLVKAADYMVVVPSVASQLEDGTFKPAVDIKKEVNPRRAGKKIVQNSTGIAENLANGIVSFYPNPSDGLINIKTGKRWLGSAFYITDLKGRQIKGGRFENETTSLNIGNLVPGIYFLHPEGMKGRSVKLYKN
jgi:hypothetical protein